MVVDGEKMQNYNIIDEYKTIDNKGNVLYLTLLETRSYIQNLILSSL